MNTEHRRRCAYRWSWLAVLLVPLPVVGQQDAKSREAPDKDKITQWRTEAEALPLFKKTEPLELQLVANYRLLLRDRDTLSVREYWGEVRVSDSSGAERRLPVRLRTRGHFRLASRNCAFVPLRLEFAKKDVMGTPFEGQDELKLVTHCNGTALYEQYVLREHLAYRLHGVLAPSAFRSRLARVAYVDSASGRVLETRPAMFLEHEGHVARRMEGEVVEIRRALFGDVDLDQMTEVALFEYFIGNSDYSLYALHNIRLVRRWSDSVLLPISYDYDFSGLVNARYATPPPQLNLRSVRDRLYRGPCRQPEEMAPHVARYLQRKAHLMALPDSIPGLDRSYVRDVREFLGEFFGRIESPRSIRSVFWDNCEKRPGM
ncbi:MAG TPA: hypothetical protein VNL96_01425 [Gemmatimonadaceae bacterium]|nr:hypothetical protein [Gemmatimonadaceae bacterium]